jgi:hypothetical protein
LLKLDFIKAYDKVPWNNMFGVIEKVGMDLIFINMVCIIFNNKKDIYKCDWCINKVIFNYTWVQQGYPLVLYLFIFVGKAFNHIIKKVVRRWEIEGIYHVLLTWQHTTTLNYFATCWCYVIHNQRWALEIVNSLIKLLLRLKKLSCDQ